MGWGYADWSGPFYPADAPSKDYIIYYARVFDTVEIDSTFYGTPARRQAEHWRKVTPETFLFCPKAPREITHDRRLVECEAVLTEFLSTMALLGPRLGPILLQLPPDFGLGEIGSIERFLPLLDGAGPDVRFALEVRNRSLLTEALYGLLREHNIAFVSTDYVAMPRRFVVTADFIYLRLIGQHGKYPWHDRIFQDRSEDLRRWAGVLRRNQEKFESGFVMCNNDYEGFSPSTANRFKALIGQPANELPAEVQSSLF